MNKETEKTGYISKDMPQIKYYRKKPILEIDRNQTMYSLVKSLNQDNLYFDAIGYMKKNTSFDRVFKDSAQLGSAFKKLGVKENDVIGIATINTTEVQPLLLATSKIGAISKWIDLRVNERDLEHYINEHHCQTLVVFEALVPIVEKIIDHTDLKKVIVVSPVETMPLPIRLGYALKGKKEGTYIKIPDDKRFVSYTEFKKTGDQNDSFVSSYDKEKPTLIIQSSGTTGKAKSIVHTDFGVNSSIYNLSFSDLPFYKGKRLLVTVPPWIGYGLINSTYLALAFGMKAEMCPKVDKSTVFDNLGKFELAFAAPLHYRYLAEKIKKCKDLSEIEVLITGGDKMTAEELKNLKDILIDKNFHGEILNGYGNNEGLGAETVNPLKHNKLGSVGIPLPNNLVLAFDENGRELKAGKIGELCTLTDSVFKEYAGNREETEKIKKLHDDGNYWIHSRDLGYNDEEGFVFVTGRLARLITRAAFKIDPETIERTISSHPAVKGCVTVGVNDKEELSVPMAFIELKEEFKDQETTVINDIEELCKKGLKSYETPAYYKIINEIPYTKNNKYDFKKLEVIGNELVKEKDSFVRTR